MNNDKNTPVAANDDDPWESLAEDLFGMPFGKEHSASENVASAAESAAADRQQAREPSPQAAAPADDTWGLEPASEESDTASAAAPVEPQASTDAGFDNDLDQDEPDSPPAVEAPPAESFEDRATEPQGRKSTASAGDSYWDALAAWSWDDSGRSAPPSSSSRSSDSGRDSRRSERPPRGSDAGRRPERRSDQPPRAERGDVKRPAASPVPPKSTPARAPAEDETDDFGTGLLEEQPSKKAPAPSGTARVVSERSTERSAAPDDAAFDGEDTMDAVESDSDLEGEDREPVDATSDGTGSPDEPGPDRKRRRRRRRGRGRGPGEAQSSATERGASGEGSQAARAEASDESEDADDIAADSDADAASEGDAAGTESERESDSGRPGRRRRPRRRRRGEPVERTGETAARRTPSDDLDSDESVIAGPSSRRDEHDEDDDDDDEVEVFEGGGRSSLDDEDDDDDHDLPAGEGDEDDEDSAEHVMTYTNVPTWEEAISYLLRPHQVQVDPAAPGAPPQKRGGGNQETGRNPTRHYGRRKP